MSNRVMNLIPAPAPQPKAPMRRSEPPAEDVSFERSLKKATPRRDSKAKETDSSAAGELDRAAETQSSGKKKAEKANETPADSTEDALQDDAAETVDAPEDEAVKTDEDASELAVAAAPTHEFNTDLTQASEQGDEGDSAASATLMKNDKPAKGAALVRELDVKRGDERPANDISATEATDGNGEFESIADELTLLQREFDALSEDAGEDISAQKSAAGGPGHSAAKPQIDLQAEPAVETAAAAETSKVATQGDTGAEMQQQAFQGEPGALQDEASNNSDASSDTGAGEAEPFADLLAKAPVETAKTQPARTVQPPMVTERVFADTNHPQIISSVKQELLPHGGTMQLRLDPPQLGPLHVTVEMRDGAMIASFQTSNDEATRLLSHSLHQLKQSLESQGVNVDRMHVQQAPRDQEMAGNEDGQQRQQSPAEQQSARQEQQRREMMQRLWRKLSGTDDFLDLVA